jgi:beta-carotene 15,15'-dioxygenase
VELNVPAALRLNFIQSAWFVSLGVVALLLLRWADVSWPSLGWWLFVVLSLTVGMGHGALDAVLLLAQFKPYRRIAAYGLVYLLLVLSAGALLAMSPGWALLALLAMSVWHFGELYRPSLAARLVVGGASVMAPMLLSSNALAAMVQPVLGADGSVVWQAWRWMAMAWALGAVAWVVWVGFKHRDGQRANTPHSDFSLRALLELAVVLALNAALSPLLAFAVHFGVWHSLGHILRVRRATAYHALGGSMPPKSVGLVVALTVVTTAILLWVLWRALPVLQGAQGLSLLGRPDHIVQWLVVALAAVTLPHMLLVGYSHRWLGR